MFLATRTPQTKLLAKKILITVLRTLGIYCGLLIIGFYRCIIRPHFLWGGCRFTPTCSVFAEKALKRFGIKKGAFLIKKRLLKCHPLGQQRV